MSTLDHYRNDSFSEEIPQAKGMKFGIVVSEWNYEITGALLQGALTILKQQGVTDEEIIVKHVPGSFELVFGANQLIHHTNVDAVLCFGSIVRGGTPHFDYVCQGTTSGIAQLNTTGDKPVIFGVLTTDNLEQAQERAGGSLGNKGEECAIAAIKMVNFAWSLKK